MKKTKEMPRTRPDTAPFPPFPIASFSQWRLQIWSARPPFLPVACCGLQVTRYTTRAGEKETASNKSNAEEMEEPKLFSSHQQQNKRTAKKKDWYSKALEATNDHTWSATDPQMPKPSATAKHKYQVTSAKTLAASSTALFFFFSFGLPCLYI